MRHVYGADRGLVSGRANVDSLLPGELIYPVQGGGLRLATGADPRIGGVIEDMPDQHIAEHPYDFRDSQDAFTYDTGDLVKYGGNEQYAKILVLTPTDNGDGDPAPDIGPNDVVGIPDRAGMEGRIVQEGYTDGQSTPVTYNRSNGNFLAIGVARGNSSSIPSNEYDDEVDILRDTVL